MSVQEVKWQTKFQSSYFVVKVTIFRYWDDEPCHCWYTFTGIKGFLFQIIVLESHNEKSFVREE